MSQKSQSPKTTPPTCADRGGRRGNCRGQRPAVVKAQGPTSFRFEHLAVEGYLPRIRLDYAKKVNDMTGGDLKIEVLPAGAVVPAFGLPRSRVQGDAGWRLRGSRLSLRQAKCAGTVGVRPGLRNGRQHAAGLQIWWRQGASCEAL